MVLGKSYQGLIGVKTDIVPGRGGETRVPLVVLGKSYRGRIGAKTDIVPGVIGAYKMGATSIYSS